MCLLVVAAGLDPDWPLVVAANRDERLDRPARAAAVLRRARPRVLGGRDQLAGGTWLAVNEHGVVAGLTNRPAPQGRDPSRRSRGELPLRAARWATAAEAAADLAAGIDPADYNAAWMLVGDRQGLWCVDVTGSTTTATTLGPGLHVLENRPPGEPSPKVDRVRALLAGVEHRRGEALRLALRDVLADHVLPEGAQAGPGRRPAAADACCVHGDEYGTRSSTLVAVPAGAGRPLMLVADGHPCTAVFVDQARRWAPTPRAPVGPAG